MPQCPTGSFLYTVRPGDTLWKIAKRYGSSIYAIASVNPGIDLNNLYVGQVICIRPEYGQTPQQNHTSAMHISKSESDLNNYLRMLWEEHVIWTRLVILSMVFNLPDVDFVTNRLLRNPEDFKAALTPIYGDKIAANFADLLKKHLTIAGELTNAAKAGNTNAAADAEKRWYSNADEIAAFLASINPYWSESDWKTMLYEHLALTKSEVNAMLNRNYSQGVLLFDEIEKQALAMADMMTSGIVKQFPNKFS